jgi:hypothetical protein
MIEKGSFASKRHVKHNGNLVANKIWLGFVIYERRYFKADVSEKEIKYSSQRRVEYKLKRFM